MKKQKHTRFKNKYSKLPAKIRPDIDFSKPLILKNCGLVDVKRGTVIKTAMIEAVDGKITYAGKDPAGTAGNAETIDCGGGFLLPGLIDAHCHATLPGTFSIESIRAAASLPRQFRRNMVQQVESGVTTIKDAASFPGLLGKLVTEVQKGVIIGPRVKGCNAFTNIKGGYPPLDIEDLNIALGTLFKLIKYGSITLSFKDMNDLKNKIEKNSEGASFIKLTMDTLSVTAGNDTKLRTYDEEHLTYIFDFAQEKELPVAGHNTTMFGFDRALKFPFTSLEHIVIDEILSLGKIRKMARKNIAIIPTTIVGSIYLFDELFSPPHVVIDDYIENEMRIRREYWNSITESDIEPAIHDRNNKMIRLLQTRNPVEMFKEGILAPDAWSFFKFHKTGRKNLMKMRDEGVLIGCGTDAGVPCSYHGTIWQELESLGRYGFTNKEIIRCATINNARILGIDDTLGSLEQGKLADMVLLKENPLKQIENCRDPLLVFKEGKLIVQRVDLERDGAHVIHVKN